MEWPRNSTPAAVAVVVVAADAAVAAVPLHRFPFPVHRYCGGYYW